MGEDYCESGATAGFTIYRYFDRLNIGEFFNYGETKPFPGNFGIAGLVNSVEPVKYFCDVILPDTLTKILYFAKSLVLINACFDNHRIVAE